MYIIYIYIYITFITKIHIILQQNRIQASIQIPTKPAPLFKTAMTNNKYCQISGEYKPN